MRGFFCMRLVSFLSYVGFCVGLSACANQSPKHNQPATAMVLSPCLEQYHQQTGPIKYGYGAGANLAAAKQLAYKDIAEQLGVNVNASNQTIQQKINDQVSQSFRSEVNSHASAKLDDLTIACLKPHNGELTLVLAYDTRPLFQQVADHFIEQWLSQSQQLTFNGPTPLVNSRFSQDVQQALQGAGTTRQLNIHLENHNGWQIKVGEQRWPVTQKQLTYVIDWHALNKGELTVTAKSAQGINLPPQLYAGTELRLDIHTNHKTSNTAGYLHVIGFYEDGSLHLVRQNLTGKQYHQIPEQGIFEAATLTEKNPSTDVYIAFSTPKPLNHYSELMQLENSDIRGNDFAHFVAELNQAAVDVGVLLVEILP